MNDDDLRAIGPAGLPADRHAALRAQLLADIAEQADRVGDDGGDAPPSSIGRPAGSPAPRGRRTWLAAAAAAVVVAIVGVAVALAVVRDDGSQLASPTTSVGAPGTTDPGPGLDEAPLTCIGAEAGSGTYATTVSLPRDGELTADDLVTACREAGPERGNTNPSVARACAAPGTDPPGLVVLLTFRPCDDEGLAELTAEDLEAWIAVLAPADPGG